MVRLPYSEIRHRAIREVRRDRVQYHNGLSGPALGYSWADHVGGQMLDDLRQALHELWAASLIDIDTHRLFALRGHRVRITTCGSRLLSEWESSGQRQAA